MVASTRGGAREGSGRKKGSTNLIRIQSLRDAFDKSLGIPFEEMLANMQRKLYNDFQNNENVDSAIRFSVNMAKHMIQPVPQVVEVEDVTSESTADLKAYRDNLLTRLALSSPALSSPVITTSVKAPPSEE